MGDGCQCGDPTGERRRDRRRRPRAARTPDRDPQRADCRPSAAACTPTAQCTLTDLVVLDRTVGTPSSEPGLAPTCQAAALHTDQSDFMFDPDRLLEVDHSSLSEADWDALRVEELDVLGLIFVAPVWHGAVLRSRSAVQLLQLSDVTVDGQTLADVGVRKKGFFGSLSTTQAVVQGQVR